MKGNFCFRWKFNGSTQNPSALINVLVRAWASALVVTCALNSLTGREKNWTTSPNPRLNSPTTLWQDSIVEFDQNFQWHWFECCFCAAPLFDCPCWDLTRCGDGKTFYWIIHPGCPGRARWYPSHKSTDSITLWLDLSCSWRPSAVQIEYQL